MGCDSPKYKKKKRSKRDLDSSSLVSDNNVPPEKGMLHVVHSKYMKENRTEKNTDANVTV